MTVEMILEIRNIEQSSFKIAVKLSDTILDVKAKIQSKIEIIDTDDQKLVYSGKILADDSTIEECDIDKNDYVTLVYPPRQKKEVGETIEKIRNTLNVGKDEMCTSQNNSKSSEHSSRDATTNETFSDQKSDEILFDSEFNELSRSALFEAIPDAKNLCNLVASDPEVVPKYLLKLCHQRPLLVETILQNQHAFIDMLDTNHQYESDNEIETVETKGNVAIDRLVEKGHAKEMVKEVYRACNGIESDAAQLLNYLN